MVTYMGYEKKQSDEISLKGKNVDLGTILLTPTVIKMDNVTVEAEKPAIRYKIDKQVIDARQFISARGGTAVDILENVPSVQVDIEGKVSLLGRTNITVMIDGRPSVLEPQDALKTIPAETIENIEIMTNPSAKFEYKRPINSTSHFETGVNANFNWKSDGNNVYHYNPLRNDFDFQNQFSNLTDYKQNTLSAYALYSAEFGQLGIQPGIRAEYTYREINSDAVDSVHVIDSLHIFPSFHLSYQLPHNIQLMGSYSHRISRPYGYQLEPFYTWRDAYNISIGNPALRPQMTDSYLLSVQKVFGRNSISLNVYYSHTNDKIESIQTIYKEGEDVILSTYENVGIDQTFSFMAMANLSIFSWWRMNVSGSLYHYQIEGELYGEDILRDFLGYSTSMMSTIIFPTKTRIQLNLRYLPK
jgi:hypothetical protein